MEYRGGVVKPEDKNILDRIELGPITLNKGINDAVPIQKSEILNSKKNGEFFIVGASINGNSAYLYSYNDGNHIKCHRHYGQDVAVGGFVVMEISSINIEDGTARIDFKAETYPLQQSVLTKTNTTPFTPTEDYHPATKKYVDDLAGGDIEKIVIQYIRDENIATAHLLTLYRKGNDGSQDFETFPKNELFAYFNKGIPCFVQDNVGSRFKITSITNHINPQVTVLYHGSIETFEITTESDYFGTNAYNIRTLSFIVFNEIKSSDIRTMNGYSLGNDKSAIKSSDSLNKAISKLESRIKALEEK